MRKEKQKAIRELARKITGKSTLVSPRSVAHSLRRDLVWHLPPKALEPTLYHREEGTSNKKHIQRRRYRSHTADLLLTQMQALGFRVER